MVRYCEYCGKEIDELNTYGSGRFCNKKCQLMKCHNNAVNASIVAINKKTELKTITKICPNCNNEFKTTSVERKFCSRTCSAHFADNKSRVRTDVVKERISNSLKRKYNSKIYYCSICGKQLRRQTKTHLCKDCLNNTERGQQIKSELGKESAEKLKTEGRLQGWKSRNITSYAENFWIKVLEPLELLNGKSRITFGR